MACAFGPRFHLIGPQLNLCVIRHTNMPPIRVRWLACRRRRLRLTLSHMRNPALTIRLDRALERQLAALAKRSGRSRSDIVRDALRRQLAILQFEDGRRSVMPFAEARGYLTDEDVFRAVS